MSSTDKPLITVVGALSKQGRSVVNTLLQSQRYRVRALTRQVNSPQAQEMALRGAELMAVPLELDHQDDFVRAFKGAHGAFLMTPPVTPEGIYVQTYETNLGKQLADAAVEAGVDHIVFSALENVAKITAGTKWVPHFTDKAKIEEYIRTLPVTSTFIYLSFFYTNLLEYYQPYLEDGALVFPVYLPEDIPAPFVDPLTATGPAVLELFDHKKKYAGQSLPVIGEILSPREIVETFARVRGIKAKYSSAYTREELVRHFPSFADMDGLVEEVTNMAAYAVEFGYYRPDRDLLWSRKINPDSLTWEQFLRATGWEGQPVSFGLEC
ncbi:MULTISPECIES: NmrA/HSCARG family protein [Yersinia]|uniref:NmrA/HSCARG family protein n=1 Tax=Yersinia TaxID=629 RepID=UPI000BFE186A|nr:MULTISPECIES: NmrA/HSCARG family protein [Yersinia]ATM85919.1 NmrA family protein [Yersinia frederiksenii]MCB5316452.1 NmrA/HSCARG family protein [Yersinia massiliensis]